MTTKHFIRLILIIGLSSTDLFAFNQSDTDTTISAVKDEQFPIAGKTDPENLHDFSIAEDWITHLPVRELGDLMLLLPGIIAQDGKFHIRAGDAFATGYMLDNIYISNPYGVNSSIYIIPSAIHSLNLNLPGSENELMGSASGYFQNRLRNGSKTHQFSVTMETDQWVDEGDQVLGTTSYQDRIFTLTAGGPIINKNTRYFIAIENQKLGDTQKRFSNGFEFSELIDMNPSNPAVGRGFPDTVDVLQYPDGFTPHNSSDRWALNSNFLINLKTITIILTGLFNTQTLYSDTRPMSNILNNRLQYWDKWNYLLNGRLNHRINEENSYTIQLGYSKSFRELNDDYFGNDWQSWKDSTKIAHHTNGRVAYRDRWRPNYNYLFNGFTFTRDGYIDANYEKASQSSWHLSGFYANRMIKNNWFRLGIYWQKQTIRQFSINPSIIALVDPLYVDANGNHLAGGYYESLSEIPQTSFYSYLGDIYGYDRFGNVDDDGLSNGASDAIQPVKATVTVQDEFDFSDFSFFAALYYTYYRSGTKILRDPRNPQFNQSTGQILASEWKDSEARTNFSPAFGLNFVLNKNHNLFAKFSSLKTYYQENLSYYEYGEIQINGQYYTSLLPLVFDEQNIKTYELGYHGRIKDFFSLNTSVYLSQFKYSFNNEVLENFYASDDGSMAYGLDFSIQTARFNRLMGMAAVTVSKTEDEHAPFSYQHSPVGFFDLDYRFGKLDGGAFFRQFGINLLFRFQSGHPYTLVTDTGGQPDPQDAGVDYMVDTRSRLALETLNASTTPWNYQFDLKIDKSFEISNGITTTFYLRILNLLNTKNILNVYETTGKADDDGFFNDPQKTAIYEQYYGERYLDLYKALNIDNGQSYWDVISKQLYGHPRQILFGVQISF